MTAPVLRPLRIWDLPTRLFHGLLATSVVASVVTAKIGGNAMEWHVRLGVFAMALLLFRLLWGFVGGHWSRFAQFVYSPASVWADLRGRAPGHAVGHSPRGALSVFAMLGVLTVQVATGLVADDEIVTTGPLNRFVPPALAERATDWHGGPGQALLIVLVLLHVGAVLYYRFQGRDLMAAMWHGDRLLEPGIPASADGARQRLLALVLAALCAWAAYVVYGMGT